MNSNESALALLPPVALARKIDAPLWNALKEIYNGASDEKVALVVDYCIARKMDPLKKPVHIVQVWSPKAGGMVETIWPSITEQRMTAQRTGLFAGYDEIKWGPTITQDLGTAKNFSFPEWAQITVYRMVGQVRCAFPGPRVYWLESYAQKKRDDYAPNAMWGKRTWGQLEKCTEAAALRRAFPEEIGGSPTGDEMDGRFIDVDTIQTVGGTAGGGDSAGTPGAAGAETAKRAAVPKKRGAAAMTVVDGPKVETESKTQVDTSIAVTAVESSALPVTEAGAEALARVAAAVADKPANPAPAVEEKPKTTGEMWPKVFTATIAECSDVKITNIPGVTTTKRVKLANGRVALNGTEVDVSELGVLYFEPTAKELIVFGKVGDEKIEFTIVERPASSNPEKKNLIVTRAAVADVSM